MRQPTLNWSREQIQKELSKDIAGLQVEFADAPWTQDLISLLKDLYEFAGRVETSVEQLADLRNRVDAILRRHKLKGFEPYLWMIDCLAAKGCT